MSKKSLVRRWSDHRQDPTAERPRQARPADRADLAAEANACGIGTGPSQLTSRQFPCATAKMSA